MEEARCWMLSKRKHSLSSNNLPYDDSWEEQAFAEDSAGPLGGCIWPPRSYSCSFCRREFRSAQALGGHMNVHRRDRARLKQSPSPQNNENVNQNHHNLFQHHFTSLGFQYPSHHICTLVYNPNPNSDLPARDDCNEKNLFPPFSSYSSTNGSTKEEHEKRSAGSSPPSWPNSDRKRKEERNSRTVESECIAKVDYVKTNDLSVSLNLVVQRTCSNEEEEEEKEAIGYKRRRITSTTTSSLPLFMKSNSEVIEISPCSREELDLELRLGDRPKVK